MSGQSPAPRVFCSRFTPALALLTIGILVTTGCRTKTVVLVTTLIDPEAYPREDLTALYGLRWEAEVCLRDLKISIGMDVLRGLSPQVVRRELLVHLLAYNLIRTMMWDAAKERASRRSG